MPVSREIYRRDSTILHGVSGKTAGINFEDVWIIFENQLLFVNAIIGTRCCASPTVQQSAGNRRGRHYCFRLWFQPGQRTIVNNTTEISTLCIRPRMCCMGKKYRCRVFAVGVAIPVAPARVLFGPVHLNVHFVLVLLGVVRRFDAHDPRFGHLRLKILHLPRRRCSLRRGFLGAASLRAGLLRFIDGVGSEIVLLIGPCDVAPVGLAHDFRTLVLQTLLHPLGRFARVDCI